MSEAQMSFGQAIKQARGRTSIRKAAARAGISEGRWRQLELGYQRAGGHEIPAQPKRETARAMAQAVGLDPDAAERLAGFEPDQPGAPAALLLEAHHGGAVAPPLDIFAAIDAEPRLLPEARQHLKNQVGLLLRLQALDPGALTEDPQVVAEQAIVDADLLADLREERKTREGRPTGSAKRRTSHVGSKPPPRTP